MTKKISITLSDWVYNDILSKYNNISAKIEESVIKQYMDDKQKLYNLSDKNKGSIETAPLYSGGVSDNLHNFFNIPQILGEISQKAIT